MLTEDENRRLTLEDLAHALRRRFPDASRVVFKQNDAGFLFLEHQGDNVGYFRSSWARQPLNAPERGGSPPALSE